MSVSDAEFRLWLKQDNKADRVWTAELYQQVEDGGEPSTVVTRFSDKPYRRGSGRYFAAILSIPEFTRELGGDNHGVYSSSYGALVIDNQGGEFDWLLDAAIDGSNIEFSLGDVSWDIADHRLIFVVKMVCVDKADTETIEVQVQDAGLLLNKSLSGQTLVGGTGPSADKPRPFNFGTVRQVECNVADAANLIYVHSDTGENTIATAVYDKLQPVVYTDLGDGTFFLADSPRGKITSDVSSTSPLGDPSDATAHRVSDLLDVAVGLRSGLIAEGLYAGPHPTFVVGDDEDYPIGVSVSETQNTMDFLADASKSGQFSWAITRLNLFTYLRIRPDAVATLPTTPFEIDADDIFTDPKPELVNDPAGYYKIRAVANMNWTQTDDIAEGLDPDDRDLRTRKGLPFEQEDGVGDTYADRPELYDLTLVPSPVLETWVSADDDDTAYEILAATWSEVERFNGLPWLRTVTFTLGMEFFEKELGDVGLITFPFFRMSGGVYGQVVRIRLMPTDFKIQLSLHFRSRAEPYPEGWERVTASPDATVESSFIFDSTAGPTVVPPLPGPPLPPNLPWYPGNYPGLGGYDWGIDGAPSSGTTESAYVRVAHFVGGVQSFDDFNTTVAMDATATTCVVGIPSTAATPAGYSGRLDVYQRSGTTWSFATSLTPTPTNDEIGYSVSISDDLTIVASEGNGQNYHIFTNTGGATWSHSAITDTSSGTSANFHPCVAINRDGDVIVLIGSVGDLAFTIWKKTGGTWAHQQTVSLGGVDSAFSCAISKDGMSIAISGADAASPTNLKVFVFLSNVGKTSWTLANNLSPFADDGNTRTADEQMIAMAADRSVIAAWAPADESPTSGGPDSVSTLFIYKSSDGGATYAQQAFTRRQAGDLNTVMGPIAITDDGNRIFFADPYYPYTTPGRFGKVYWMDKPWQLAGLNYWGTDPRTNVLPNPYGATSNQSFGESMACSADGSWWVVTSGDWGDTGAYTVDFFQWQTTFESLAIARATSMATAIGSYDVAASGIGEVQSPGGAYVNSNNGNQAQSPDGAFLGQN